MGGSGGFDLIFFFTFFPHNFSFIRRFDSPVRFLCSSFPFFLARALFLLLLWFHLLCFEEKNKIKNKKNALIFFLFVLSLYSSHLRRARAMRPLFFSVTCSRGSAAGVVAVVVVVTPVVVVVAAKASALKLLSAVVIAGAAGSVFSRCRCSCGSLVLAVVPPLILLMTLLRSKEKTSSSPGK